jgi:hypothetical protein
MPVTSVNQTQQVDAAGDIQNVYEITFTISGRSGSFTVDVPADENADANAQAAIQAIVSQVGGIYGIGV